LSHDQGQTTATYVRTYTYTYVRAIPVSVSLQLPFFAAGPDCSFPQLVYLRTREEQLKY